MEIVGHTQISLTMNAYAHVMPRLKKDAARPNPFEELQRDLATVMRVLTEVRFQVRGQQADIMGRFDSLDASSKELVTKVDAAYAGLMQSLTDEARDGPRLFSIEPVDSGFFDRPGWISEKFRITLWCEH